MLDDEDSQQPANQEETKSAEKDPQQSIAPNPEILTGEGTMIIDTTDARESHSGQMPEESKVRNDEQEESTGEQPKTKQPALFLVRKMPATAKNEG